MIRRFLLSCIACAVVFGGAWFVWERYIDQDKVRNDITDVREKARVFSQQAQDKWAETKNKFSRMKEELDQLESKYGNIIETKENAESSLLSGTEDLKQGAYELNNVAVLQMNKEKPADAVKSLEKAILTLKAEGADPSDLAHVYENYATALELNDQADEAAKARAEAKKLSEAGKGASDKWSGEKGLRIFNK